MAFTIAVIGFILIIGGCFAGFFFKTFLMEDINGVICSFERLYFDIMEGQINLGLPKWPGLNNMSYKLDTLYNVLQTISSTTNNYDPNNRDGWYNNENSQLVYVNYEKAIEKLLEIKGEHNYHYLSDRGNNYSSIIQTDYVGKINFEAFKGFNYYVPTLNELQRTISLLASSGSSLSNLVKSSITDLSSFQGSFSDFKGNVLDDIDDYQGYVEDYGDPALIAIFSILLGFAIIGLFSLFFYVFSKNQTPSRIILHFVWNFSTFFTFLSLILGGTFGIVNIAGRDGIGFMRYIFSEDNLKETNDDPKLIPSGKPQEYLQYCLDTVNDNPNLADKLKLSDDSAKNFLDSIYGLTLTLLNNQKEFDNYLILQPIENLKISIKNYQADVLLAVLPTEHLIEYFDSINNALSQYNANITSNKNRCSSSQYEILLPGQSLTNRNKKACLDINDWKQTQIESQFSILQSNSNLQRIYEYQVDNYNTALAFLTQLEKIQNEYLNGMNNLNQLINEVNKDFGSLVTEFQSISTSGDIFSFLSCRFMNNYLNIVYETFSDLSDSSKYLCVILLCVSFVEIITIYCVMLTIFRFDNRIQIHHNISYLSEKVKMNKDEEAEPIQKDTEANEKLNGPPKPTTESIKNNN